jgi:heme oxygenase (mycobilin-producing)
MFVGLSKFTVNNKDNMTASVKNAFVERPHLVENAPGFVRLDVLNPLENQDEIWLLTYWTNQTSFQEWYRTHRYKEAHANIPPGIRLINDQTEMLFFEHISS